MSELTQVIDSPTILIYDDCLDFNPFQCETLQEVKLRYDSMLCGINRCALYYAYSMGKLLDEKSLKSKFGITSVTELAKVMDLSIMSLHRYRRVYELLTENQVRSLACRAVSINAILKIAEIKEDYPKEADKLLDALMCGELRTAKDLDAAKVKMIEDLMSVRNLLPDKQAEAVNQADDTCDTDTTGTDDSIIDVEIVTDSEGSEFDEQEEDDISDTTVSSDIIDLSAGESQNKRDIRNLLRSCRTELAPVRRDLVSVQEDIPAQLEVILGREDVILGDEESHEEYTKLLTEFFELCQGATEKLAVIVEKGIERGILKRPCVLPESTNIDKLFRTED